MKCPHCGAKIDKDSKFCPMCGRPLLANVDPPKLEKLLGRVVEELVKIEEAIRDLNPRGNLQWQKRSMEQGTSRRSYG